jgi:signal transduction histidine kinase
MNKFQNIKKELRKHEALLNKMLAKAESLALKGGDHKFVEFIQKEQERVKNTLASIVSTSNELYPSFQKELKKRTSRLETKIETLNKAKDVLVSDNYLLEYKKKDLLILANKLEEANEEISKKNQELLQQQDMIGVQQEKLNAIHEEILAKNEELEIQKEALLDQSDYLHEANETITHMHHEVEKQKNEILQKNEELLILNNEKNNLIGIVAHDLKSPLNQIRGLLSIMKLTVNNLSDDALQYIDMMEKSSERLSDMIGKILDVEAIESKKLNLVMEETDLGVILNSLVTRYDMAAQQKSIRLQGTIGTAVAASVDSSYCEQVFENLLSNAIKFSPKDRNIYVVLSESNGRAICEIKDEGPGLTEEDKKKLFGKYQKLSARPTGNETSTGLGLSIVKKFVEAMQGQIWCESEAGKGASFFVAFPILKPAKKSPDIISSKTAG